jgi:hypothetical protein
MGRTGEVSYEPSLLETKGYKLIDHGLPLGSEIADKGKDYQDFGTEIAHFLEPRWKDTP